MHAAPFFVDFEALGTPSTFLLRLSKWDLTFETESIVLSTAMLRLFSVVENLGYHETSIAIDGASENVMSQNVAFAVAF